MWYIGGSATDREINTRGHMRRPRAEFLLDEVFPEAIGIIRDKMVALGVPIPYMHTVFEYQKGESYERWLQKKSQSNSP